MRERERECHGRVEDGQNPSKGTRYPRSVLREPQTHSGSALYCVGAQHWDECLELVAHDQQLWQAVGTGYKKHLAQSRRSKGKNRRDGKVRLGSQWTTKSIHHDKTYGGGGVMSVEIATCSRPKLET